MIAETSLVLLSRLEMGAGWKPLVAPEMRAKVPKHVIQTP